MRLAPWCVALAALIVAASFGPTACGGKAVVEQGGLGGAGGATSATTSNGPSTVDTTGIAETATTGPGQGPMTATVGPTTGTGSMAETVTTTGTGPSDCDNTGDCGDSSTGCIGCSLAGECSDEYDACASDQDCIDFSTCAGVCADPPCVGACAQQHPTGAQIYQALYDCAICIECAIDCSNQPADGFGCRGVQPAGATGQSSGGP